MKRFKVWYITDRSQQDRFLETYANDNNEARTKVLNNNHKVKGFEVMKIEQVTKIKGG